LGISSSTYRSGLRLGTAEELSNNGGSDGNARSSRWASGIGRAELFVEEGARVVIADVADEPGRERSRDKLHPAVFHHTDVSAAADVEALVEFALQRSGPDVRFNNAGISNG
jgi:NAD(P)-dependent dehydrogenase (short-subunit alcohol dehydrogenase family)